MPSQTLALTQSQRLQMILAPQLRQSLEMLQLPVMELRTMVQQELEKNPTLEEGPSTDAPVEIEPGASTDEPSESKELDFEKEFETLAQLDAEWRDYFYQNLSQQPYNPEAQEKHQFMLDSLPQRISLQEHLLEQLHLADLNADALRIGEMIIGSISDDGYLTSSLEELASSTGVSLELLRDLLVLIQDFHPTGVGARDLRECLLLQLERLDKEDTLAHSIVMDHLERLGRHRLHDIAKMTKTTLEAVQEAARLITSLDPKPGRMFSDDVSSYIVAEVVVRKVDGEYVVILDDDQLPHVRISRHYRGLLASADTRPEVRDYIRERIRAGAFLIKSIHQRQKTIQRIAVEIVNRQTAFLDRGVEALRPLTMGEVATVVGVHETTVSRAVSGKYMRTPRGIFEMKYFFTPGIRTADGTEVSNKTVKDMIGKLVADEDPASPLSDQQILNLLRERGIKLARRTVAKYRLVLAIPPSHMRKQY